MKKIAVAFLLLFSATLASAQEQKEIKVVTSVKGADPKENRPGEKKSENHSEIKSDEPVIIQRLEYTAPGYTPIVPNETKVEETKVESSNTDEETIDPVVAIDNNIKAIDSKVEWVKNNPAEDKKAKETGWYQQMEENKKALQKKKEELTNSGK